VTKVPIVICDAPCTNKEGGKCKLERIEVDDEFNCCDYEVSDEEEDE
jgi:hypothetical protein